MASSLPGTERFIDLEQIFNFRDLGGLQGRLGTIRSGLVYRSARFEEATDTDIKKVVDTLGLKAVIDLRRADEIAGFGTFPQDVGVDYHHLEFKHLRWEYFERSLATNPNRNEFLIQRFSAMLETGSECIKDSLDLMCENTPVVFHCMAGKDRTGLVAAVTLGLLGIDDEDIAIDYSLTQIGMRRFSDWLSAKGETPPPFKALETPVSVMRTVLQGMEANYGSFIDYARIIGFKRVDELRERLLT